MTGGWLEGEPSNGLGRENCVEITGSGLNDVLCEDAKTFICEKGGKYTYITRKIQLHNIFVNAFLFGQHTLLNITHIHINIEVANGVVAL